MQLKHGIMPQGTLFVPLYGTRFRYSPLCGVNLPMAVGVYKNAILYSVAATFRFMDDVVVVPTCFYRDWLFAIWTDAFLSFPQFQQLVSAPQDRFHLRFSSLR
jgi:hypothetical protein